MNVDTSTQDQQPLRLFTRLDARVLRHDRHYGLSTLFIGDGELRVPLGVTIVGGLLLSQLLTLYTTPVIYLGVERLRRRLSGEAVDPGPITIAEGAP